MPTIIEPGHHSVSDDSWCIHCIQSHKTPLDSKHIWIQTHSFSLRKRSHLISRTIELPCFTRRLPKRLSSIMFQFQSELFGDRK